MPLGHPARFKPQKSLIGMVHAGALPGTPANETTIDLIAAQAATEATILAEAGFDAIIVENMHDRPYAQGGEVGHEITAAMTRVALEVQAVAQLPLGVQVLSCGNEQAMAVAAASSAAFVRCENFVFAHTADEGLLARAEAGGLLRMRRRIGAGDVAVFADVQKKHASHAITADLSIEQLAEAAAFFGADGLIVTGAWTGRAASVDDVRRVRAAGGLPVLVGSGVTPENAAAMIEHADGLIVGSAIKQGGVWSGPVDPARCRGMVAAVRAARGR